MALRDQGHPDQGIAAHTRALALLAHDSTTPEALYELARTHYLLHKASHRPHPGKRTQFTSKRRDPANDGLEAAIDILENLVKQFPSVPEYKFLLAQCNLERNRLPFPGEWSRSARCDKAAVEILRELIEAYPDVPDYRFVLGDALWTQAFFVCRKDAGETKPADAEARLQEALDVTEDLDLHHPNIPEYLMLRSRLHYFMGKLQADLSRYDDAVRQFRLAARKQEQVIRQASEPRGHEFVLCGIQVDLASALQQSGQTAEASRLLDRQIKRLSELVDRTVQSDERICGHAKGLLCRAQEIRDGWRLHENTSGQMNP
jgi:tetratricopeptide (TPR) repeat protein